MLYLVFGEDKKARGKDIKPKELYKIFNDKNKAEKYKKEECEIEEKNKIFSIEEWEIS